MAYSEPYDKLDPKTLDITRAMTSLREELEAVDYYNQRVATATDPELKRIMEHNRDEEKEHAAMLMEYLRRVDPKFEHEFKDILFSEKRFEEMG